MNKIPRDTANSDLCLKDDSMEIIADASIENIAASIRVFRVTQRCKLLSSSNGKPFRKQSRWHIQQQDRYAVNRTCKQSCYAAINHDE